MLFINFILEFFNTFDTLVLYFIMLQVCKANTFITLKYSYFKINIMKIIPLFLFLKNIL